MSRGDLFQSTRPVRGATICRAVDMDGWIVSIHAPRAGRDTVLPLLFSSQGVSIHAPRAGRDICVASSAFFASCFNPRAPCGARRIRRRRRLFAVCFNPRAPCGARHGGMGALYRSRSFQSTRPVRGATKYFETAKRRIEVSIHAPRAGRDLSQSEAVQLSSVSIHAPRAGRDTSPSTPTTASPCFNPRAPCGARRRRIRYDAADRGVSIHAPRAGRDSKRSHNFPLLPHIHGCYPP